ncbi:hypothetical protein [Fredinandcohnia quinoae]|uniref:Uncharacterized protein n=1 Tax=Fredinandcohnia quinoae TaxID=2918902 RepID=A0AAW5E3F4_9BACI|nr:hypothetical protein [Fredinandcohnia sp. SECRCQ15]MCH1625324.1 hypothetical protein [Fredinandcohnia sp. SECRCQ15]
MHWAGLFSKEKENFGCTLKYSNKKNWGYEMGFNFLELLAIFTVFYIYRLLFDSKYKTREKKKIAFDVVAISILAFLLQRIIDFFFN